MIYLVTYTEEVSQVIEAKVEAISEEEAIAKVKAGEIMWSEVVAQGSLGPIIDPEVTGSEDE